MLNNKFCCLSTFNASFLFGVIFLFYYSLIIAGSSIHLFQIDEEESTNNTSVRFSLTILIIFSSSMTIVSVVLLFMGLCVESRRLLIPIIVMLIITTIIEFCNSMFNYNLCKRNLELLGEIIISLIKCFAIICVYSETKKVKKSAKYRNANFANALNPSSAIRSINRTNSSRANSLKQKELILVEDSSF